MNNMMWTKTFGQTVKQTIEHSLENSIFARWWDSLVARKDAYHQRYLAEQERQHMLSAIRKAHREWQDAKQQLDHVDHRDQIDCAIYNFEAAQKRYEMLIRQAKTVKLEASEIQINRFRRVI
jgi:hypothetical protein